MMTPRNKHKMLRERKSVQRTDSLVLLVREEVTMRNGKSEVPIAFALAHRIIKARRWSRLHVGALRDDRQG